MRNPYINPVPLNPRTPEEQMILEAVKKQTIDSVMDIWTRESYSFDDEEERSECTADFVVHTSELINGLYIGTKIYLVWLNSQQVKIEFYGSSI